LDPSTAKYEDFAPLLRALDSGLRPFAAEYLRRHHVGVDASTTLGPWVLKLDAAYQSARVFYHRDLSSMSSPTVLAVMSFEYQTGDFDRALIVELVYARLLDAPTQPLLVYNRDSYGAASVLRWSLVGPLQLELRAMGGLSPQFYVLQPALQLNFGSLHVKAGAILLNGETGSLGNYYRHNAEVFAQLRGNF
ncbi:MAG TPA: hypothetical protein VJR89_03065, partial [Polyangiales bacterium]|nr:hypothetical protein [Polyangiales bacterium]